MEHQKITENLLRKNKADIKLALEQMEYMIPDDIQLQFRDVFYNLQNEETQNSSLWKKTDENEFTIEFKKCRLKIKRFSVDNIISQLSFSLDFFDTDEDDFCINEFSMTKADAHLLKRMGLYKSLEKVIENI
jgi:hypothetical protein